MKISLAISFLSSSREKTRLYRALNWYHRRWMIISLPVSLIPWVSLRWRDRGMQSIRSTGILLPSRCSFPLRSRFFLSVSKRRLLHRFSHERFTVDLSPILSCSSIGLFWNHQFLKESLWTKRRKSGCFNNESCYWRSFLFECDLNIYIYAR